MNGRVFEYLSLSLSPFFFLIHFIFIFLSFTSGAGRLNRGLRWSASARQQRGLDFLNDTLFHIELLMLPAEAPRAYSFAVPLRIVLWQHAGDLRPLGGITKEKRPARAGTRTRDPELVCPTASYQATASTHLHFLTFIFTSASPSGAAQRVLTQDILTSEVLAYCV